MADFVYIYRNSPTDRDASMGTPIADHATQAAELARGCPGLDDPDGSVEVRRSRRCIRRIRATIMEPAARTDALHEHLFRHE